MVLMMLKIYNQHFLPGRRLKCFSLQSQLLPILPAVASFKFTVLVVYYGFEPGTLLTIFTSHSLGVLALVRHRFKERISSGGRHCELGTEAAKGR